MNRQSMGRIVFLRRTGPLCMFRRRWRWYLPNLHMLSLPSEGTGDSDRMETKILKWVVDLALGVTFAVCFVTGLLKFPLLLQATGLYRLVLPSALISDLHDWSGLFLGFFVLLHLSLNRIWIIAMTKKVLTGNR